jgi:hypothetical protein
MPWGVRRDSRKGQSPGEDVLRSVGVRVIGMVKAAAEHDRRSIHAEILWLLEQATSGLNRP